MTLIGFVRTVAAGMSARLAERTLKLADAFNTFGQFLWASYAPKWIDLLSLYDSTYGRRYPRAARQYAMFTWMPRSSPTKT